MFIFRVYISDLNRGSIYNNSIHLLYKSNLPQKAENSCFSIITLAHILVFVRDGFSVSGIFHSLQREQEVVLAFALLLLNLDLPAPEGVTQGRKLRLARSGNVNAVIVLKPDCAKI